MNIRLNFVLLTLALAVGGFALAVTLGSSVADSPIASAIAGGCLLLIGTLGWYEWRRDRRTAAMFWMVWTATTVFASGAVMGMFSGATVWIAAIVLSVALGLSGWLGLVLWREARFKELRPDWLGSQFHSGALFEDDGLEWALSCDGSDLSRGTTLKIYLQNNVEAERLVQLRLRDEHGPLSRRGKLLFSKTAPVALVAGAHAVVSVSVAAKDERPIEGVKLFVEVEAKGPTAPRNRRRRSHPGPRRVPRWMVLIGPLVGLLVLRRGGVFVSVFASGGPRQAPWSEESHVEHLP
jgi:hypothetical protein